jgi:hypothetical protein
MVLIMKRVVAITACGLSLAACSSMPNWMQLDTPSFMKSAPAATTMQFESEPAGAEARTSLGQACRTPCSAAVTANEFTVSFTLPGYAPQTIPIKVVAAADGEARLVPNPVFVELHPASPPPAAKPAPKRKPKPAPRPAPTAMAPEPAPSPAPAPASPWPPAR